MNRSSSFHPKFFGSDDKPISFSQPLSQWDPIPRTGDFIQSDSGLYLVIKVVWDLKWVDSDHRNVNIYLRKM